MKEARISIRTDKGIKETFKQICKKLSITQEDAIIKFIENNKEVLKDD